MALSNIEKIRLQTGDRVEPYFVTDQEIEDYLDTYNNNVSKASQQIKYNILYQLAANPSIYRERTGEEEVFTGDAYKNYRDALLLSIKYPHQFLDGIMPYAAGLTKSDASKYTSNLDNNIIGSNLPKNSNTEHNIEDQLESYQYPNFITVVEI